MSDSSGRVNYEKLKKTIRIKLQDLKEIRTPPSARDIWVPLQKQTNLPEAYLRSEMTDHLKTLARFIETANSRGLETVLKEFDLDEQSAFTTLQRKIRTAKARKETTEYNGAADRAFQLGSAAWAAKLLHKTDPTKFKLKDLVAAIQSDPEEALSLAAQLVLSEYGERLLRSAVPGGTTDNKDVGSVLRDYRENFEEFKGKNSKATAWSSDTIVATLQKYVNQLTQK